MADFARADIDKIVEQLTTDEAILLTAGVGFWRTHAVPRLGIPAIKVSDGPNGIRGNHFLMSTPAKCLPSSTALGATFDPELIYKVGHNLLAPEAKLRGANIILAPTCNIQRNPLGGRAFESFAEDPILSGHIAAAYVRGTQDGGIGTTIKHFVCNDQEMDRMGSDSIVSERALREIYLMPFMLAQKYAQPWAFMTSYNRVNGTHSSENSLLIQKILRDEWKYGGMMMSDWFGVYSIDHSINAGLDLEMPGTNKWRTLEAMNRSISARKITVRTVKERARKVLELVQKSAHGAPEIVGGDQEEKTIEKEEDRKLMADVGAQSIVLLKNDGNVLPLNTQKIKKVAIVGGNAKAKVLSGGGSAALRPSFFVSPYDGLVSALPQGVEVTYAEGAPTWMNTPTLEDEIVTTDGRPGFNATWYAHKSDDSMTHLPDPYSTQIIDETRIFISESGSPRGITTRYTLVLEAKLKARTADTPFEFGLTSAGRAKLFVDGELLIDNWTRQTRGDAFFGGGSTEERGVTTLKQEVEHKVKVVYCNVRAPADGDEDEAVMISNPGVRLGGAPVQDADATMTEAVKLASEADVVVAFVGLNGDWETEGNDRVTLALPGRTNELVERVATANPNTIVVNQSGSAVLMPWVDKVPTILQAWYLGNATGLAIASVLLGQVNPSGKMSMTFPKRLEDVPSHGHFRSENGKVRYAEDLFVGYKGYVHRNITPLWAFGHGLSYTSFEISDLSIDRPSDSESAFSRKLLVKVKNTGSLVGAEVVQLYITLPTTSSLTHPPLRLAAFKKVLLQPGAESVVELEVDKYAVSYWEERIGKWVVERGVYGVKVGNASNNLTLSDSIEMTREVEWNGL